MGTEYATLETNIRTLFKTVVTAGVPVTTQFENQEFSIPSLKVWTDLTIVHEDTVNLTFGEVNQYRASGQVRCDIYSPADSGEEAARQIADTFTAGFRGVKASGVSYFAPTHVESGAGDGDMASWWKTTYAAPFRYDFAEARPVSVPKVSPPTRETVSDILIERFKTDVAVPQNLTVLYDNIDTDVPTDAIWIRLRVLDGEGGWSRTGPSYRTTGMLIAQVFAPHLSGTAARAVVLDGIATAFRALTIQGVACATPRVLTVGNGEARESGWWQTNILCPFMFQE